MANTINTDITTYIYIYIHTYIYIYCKKEKSVSPSTILVLNTLLKKNFFKFLFNFSLHCLINHSIEESNSTFGNCREIAVLNPSIETTLAMVSLYISTMLGGIQDPRNFILD